MSPLKAEGVGELGISGVAPAIANAVYNATGIRIREYPLTLDKHLDKLPQIAWSMAAIPRAERCMRRRPC